MRAQDGQAGANLNAAQKAWPRVVGFLSSAFTSGVSREAQPPLVAQPVGESFTCVCDDEPDTTVVLRD